MPKDYAHYAQKMKNQKNRLFTWRKIFLFILIIIIFAGGVLYFQTHSTHKKQKIKKTTKPAKIKLNDKKSPFKIHFDFYTLLPKMKVEVLNGQNEESAVSQKSASYYILQIASFPVKNDATAYQKKINQLGFHTKLFAVNQNNAQLYRIEMGPFKDQKATQTIHDQLQQKSIDSVILKVTE